ncbi:TPA: phage tail protein, partial [Burkholderia lata]
AETPVETEAEAIADAPAPADKSTLHVSRPTQNELTLTINGESITLHPEQLSQLIEELAHARASMQPEPPPGIPSGWRFVTTKNPMMAVQKQANGDRLLVARHTGYGWVPFTFSPDVVVQMYMMLTQR